MSAFSLLQETVASSSASPEYIFDVCISPDGEHHCISLSDGSIAVLSANNFATMITSRIQAHSNRISSVQYSPVDPNIVVTASADHSVCAWDLRVAPASAPSSSSSSSSYSSATNISKPVQKIILPGEVSAASVGVNGAILAAAYENSLRFYDFRQPTNRPLGEYSDCHTDEITAVKFSPLQGSSLLLTGGEDGLIVVYDPSVSANDEAVVSIMNAECPTRRIGFFGRGYEGIYCLSSVETASIWHYPSARRISAFPDIRESMRCDYLVDCLYEESSDSLCMLAGDHEGKGIVTKLQPGNTHSVCGNLNSGHNTTLRCCAHLQQQGTTSGNIRLVTGAEDGKLCRWEGINSDDYNSSNNINKRKSSN